MSEILGNAPSEETTKRAENFIQEFIEQDLAEGKVQTVKTRFPPEPNGYLHIGHAKALWIDFSTAEKYGGSCNLRFDDTNPAKEDEEFVDAIMEDIHWLGYSWDKLCYGSSYFDQCYELASSHPKGRGVCGRPVEGRDARIPRDAHRAGQEQSVPRPQRGGEPRLVHAHEERGIPGRQPHAACQDRHGFAEHQHARPGTVPHFAHFAPSDGRYMVHLSDV